MQEGARAGLGWRGPHGPSSCAPETQKQRGHPWAEQPAWQSLEKVDLFPGSGVEGAERQRELES